LVAKYSKLNEKVSVVQCSVLPSKSGCNCSLGVGIEGGKDEVYKEAKEIDGKKPVGK
jgi:hypothetical protein